MSDDFGNQRQRLIELIQGIYQLRQQPMDANRYKEIAAQLSFPSLTQIEQVFGSWDALLQAANLPVKDNLTNQTRRPYTNRTRSIWSAEQSFSFYEEQRGKYISIREYKELRQHHPEMISPSTINYQYGSWKQAVQHHGLISTKQFTHEEYLTALNTVYEKSPETFNSNTYTLWSKGKRAPSLTSIFVHFKSWEAASTALMEWRTNRK